MEQHHWLESVIEDIVTYCDKNGLECTKLVLSAAGDILISESDASRSSNQSLLNSSVETGSQKIH